LSIFHEFFIEIVISALRLPPGDLCAVGSGRFGFFPAISLVPESVQGPGDRSHPNLQNTDRKRSENGRKFPLHFWPESEAKEFTGTGQNQPEATEF
jgi:hypothetical protein